LTQINPSKALYIGITGAFNSGCTESAKYLEDKHGFTRVSLSEALRKEFNLDKDTPRWTQQDKGNLIRKDKGSHILMDLALKEKVEEEATTPYRLVAETIRHPEEAEFFLRTFPNAYIITIYASQEDRIIREEAHGEIDKETFIEADIRDSGNTEPEYGQQITKCVNMADYFINNSEGLQKLKGKLDLFVNQISGEAEYEVETHEVMMSHAFMQRLLSKCLGRQVGAVIAKDKHVISAGWNSVPDGMPDCKQCNRKAMRECKKCGADLLSNLGTCPNTECGHKNDETKPLLEKHLDLCYSVHAEERAIMRALKSGFPLEDATLYCTTSPCLLCAKLIVESGLKKVLYVEPYPFSESETILNAGGVKADRFFGFTARHLYRLHARKE